jgi:hypothetical protein
MASTHYIRERSRRATEHGKKMATERWRLDRERRNKLAAMEPINYPGRIVRRIIVITNEVEVREAILYDTDSWREARRKLNRVMQ